MNEQQWHDEAMRLAHVLRMADGTGRLLDATDAQAAILAATERAAKAEKDAARYRWLRDSDWSSGSTSADMDQEIDQHLGTAK